MLDNWKDLSRPEIEVKELTNGYGRVDLEPFERGFGTTVGNALRRTLLSSLKGAAISSVFIHDVLHEFSTIDGVKEDVTDIALNLKEVRLRVFEGQRHEGELTASSEGQVTAGDLQFGPEVEVLNPEFVIATLAPGASLRMGLVVKRGSGYLTSDRNREESAPVGTITLDTSYSPISRVNFSVTGARVGQRTDYDKLSLQVWTDGSVRPDDAVALAARILQDQVQVFINFDVNEVEAQAEKEVTSSQLFSDSLYRCVDELDLSVRSANCLQNADIKYIGELVQKSEGEMLKTKNFGRKSLLEIKDLLITMDLNLGMRLDSFPERDELDKLRLEQETF